MSRQKRRASRPLAKKFCLAAFSLRKGVGGKSIEAVAAIAVEAGNAASSPNSARAAATSKPASGCRSAAELEHGHRQLAAPPPTMSAGVNPNDAPQKTPVPRLEQMVDNRCFTAVTRFTQT